MYVNLPNQESQSQGIIPVPEPIIRVFGGSPGLFLNGKKWYTEGAYFRGCNSIEARLELAYLYARPGLFLLSETSAGRGIGDDSLQTERSGHGRSRKNTGNGA